MGTSDVQVATVSSGRAAVATYMSLVPRHRISHRMNAANPQR